MDESDDVDGAGAGVEEVSEDVVGAAGADSVGAEGAAGAGAGSEAGALAAGGADSEGAEESSARAMLQEPVIKTRVRTVNKKRAFM